MQRLGRNRGRYHGEAIDIDAFLGEIHQLAMAHGWRSETFLDVPGIALRGYLRESTKSRNLYFATGIHGDEPAGPLAIRELVRENAWPDANLFLVPCLNPTGFRLNTRENAQGVDLNRDYRSRRSREIAAHVAWLERQPRFETSILLHEDWEADGFYVYELNPENRLSLAEPVVSAVRERCPIESTGRVDDFICEAGIIRPQVKPEERPQWAEAIYMIAHKSTQSYTLETPSDYELPVRVAAHLTAMRAALQILATISASDD